MKYFTQLIILFALTLMVMVGCISVQTRMSANKCIDKKKISTEVEIAKCPRTYEPVCGCDRKTYGNVCVAEKSGVVSWTDGDCMSFLPCIDEEAAKKYVGCQQNWEPVCGCNGKTYGNDCEARIYGVTRWKPGVCPN